MPPVTVRRKPVVAKTRVPGGEEAESGYNFALVCGNRVEIFPPDRFMEMKRVVERALASGCTMEDVSITLLEDEDPWK